MLITFLLKPTPFFESFGLCTPGLTKDMNHMLSTKFLECEVSLALKQTTPLKASGLDGMPPLFFQHFWNIVNRDVVGLVLS